MRILKIAAIFILVAGALAFWGLRTGLDRIPASIESGPFGDIKNFKTEFIRSLNIEKAASGPRSISFAWEKTRCQFVDEIELSLSLEGMSQDGDPVQKVFRVPCEPNAEIRSTITLPESRFAWTLTSVKLLAPGGTVLVSMTGYEMISVRGTGLVANYAK